MFSLLPEKQKKIISAQYKVRLISLWFLALTTVSIIFFFSVLPSYFYSSNKMVSAQAKSDTKNSAGDTPDASFVDEIEHTLVYISKLEVVDPVNIMRPIEDLISIKKGVVINSVRITRGTEGNLTVSVSANAPKREDLVAFSKAVKADTRFKEVAIPISEFAKNTNISFSFNVTIKY